MKKQFVITVALMLLLSGCSSESAKVISPDQTTTADTVETTAQSQWEKLDNHDFQGEVYTILDNNQYPKMHINIPGDEMNGEIVNDALFNRDIAVSSRFNVNIEYVQYNDIMKMINSVMAGDKEYNLCISQIYNHLETAANYGAMANLCDMSDLSLSAKWWSPLIYEQLQLNGKLLYTASDIAPAVYQSPLCMFMNLGLYNDYNMETDVWQLVLDGKWTLDSVAMLTKDMDTDLNQDNIMSADDDFFGIAMLPTEEASNAFVSGAGVRFCRLSADKQSIERASIAESDIVTVIEKIKKFATRINYNSLNDIITKTFVENRALFLQHKLESAAVHLRNMENDYLILPMPKADEDQEHYISCVSGFVSGFVGIPATSCDEFTGFITEALARYSNEFIRPQAYETVYKAKSIRDERSAEVLDIIFDNLYLDFGVVNDFAQLSYKYRDIIFDDKPIVSTLESISGTVDSEIAKLIESLH